MLGDAILPLFILIVIASLVKGFSPYVKRRSSLVKDYAFTSSINRQSAIVVNLFSQSNASKQSSAKCKICNGKRAVNCNVCKGTGIDKVNGNVFERW
jgi:hypothetical protein